jgi:cyclase
MSDTHHNPPAFTHYQLEQIAEGVHAAIAVLGGGGFGNAGIIDLGDQTLVFDTGETPAAADELKSAAERLTGRPASFVVNSHSHLDHWLGNQVFADHATIISTREAREQMIASLQVIRGYQDDPARLEDIRRGDEERLEAATDPRQRALLEASISRMGHLLQALPSLDLKPPTVTFDGGLSFYGSRRTAVLITNGRGHSPGDCILLLEDEKVAFVGDLAFFGRQPFMGDCDPATWVTQLEDLEAADIQTFVPGHGPPGTEADIALEKQYLVTLKDLVAQAIEDGTPVEETLSRPLPTPFDAWSPDGKPQEANVRMLYQRLSE